MFLDNFMGNFSFLTLVVFACVSFCVSVFLSSEGADFPAVSSHEAKCQAVSVLICVACSFLPQGARCVAGSSALQLFRQAALGERLRSTGERGGSATIDLPWKRVHVP